MTHKLDGNQLGVKKIYSCDDSKRRISVKTASTVGRSRTFKDNTKVTFANFPADTIVNTNEVCVGGCLLGHMHGLGEEKIAEGLGG